MELALVVHRQVVRLAFDLLEVHRSPVQKVIGIAVVPAHKLVERVAIVLVAGVVCKLIGPVGPGAAGVASVVALIAKARTLPQCCTAMGT
jgi:hypothetical protein